MCAPHTIVYGRMTNDHVLTHITMRTTLVQCNEIHSHTHTRPFIWLIVHCSMPQFATYIFFVLLFFDFCFDFFCCCCHGRMSYTDCMACVIHECVAYRMSDGVQCNNTFGKPVLACVEYSSHVFFPLSTHTYIDTRTSRGIFSAPIWRVHWRCSFKLYV